MIKRLRAERIGPIHHADIVFGDLTVFVGPQATGKSIFLQIAKLLADKSAVHSTMQRLVCVRKEGAGKKTSPARQLRRASENYRQHQS